MTLKIKPIEFFSVQGFVPPAEIAKSVESLDFYRAGRRPVFTGWSETLGHPGRHSIYKCKAAGEGLYEFPAKSDELVADDLEAAKAKAIALIGKIPQGTELTFNLLRVEGVDNRFWIAALQTTRSAEAGEWL